MKSIVVKNVVINLDKFICAEAGCSIIKVYLEGMPSPHNYVVIKCDKKENCQDVLEYINKQIRLQG